VPITDTPAPTAPQSCFYCQNLNTIFDSIRSEGEQINLDYVDFSGQKLVGLNLSGASMLATKFNGANLLALQLHGANLTGASFQQTHFVRSDLGDAILTKTVFDRTGFDRVDLSGADLTGAGFSAAIYKHVTANRLITDDYDLGLVLRLSVYSREQVKSDPVVGDAMRDYLKMAQETPSSWIVILSGRFTSGDPSAMTRLFIHP
jgi:hypothetical protein